MRIELLKNYDEHKKGDILMVEDANAVKYISAGIAKQLPDPSALENMGEIIAAGVAKGLAAAEAQSVRNHPEQHPANARVNQGEFVDTNDGQLRGMPIFGSKGGFLYVVTDMATGNPSTDSARKINDWREMQQKAGLAPETKGLGEPSGMHEGSDSDGGVLVLPEFAKEIYERSVIEGNFLSQSNNTVVRGNTLSLLGVDDASRANGSRWGGIQGYWANEAELMVGSRPKFRMMDLRLKKLYVLAYVTDELLDDSAYALEQRVGRGAAKEIAFKTSDAMVNGTGAGVPLGITKSPSAIVVTKEVGQPAATLYPENIEKMWSRLNPAYRGSAVWLTNIDIEPALQAMTFNVGLGGSMAYQPQGGIANPAYATLKGRPVQVCEFCEALGTQGDIILTSWAGYESITKGDVKTDMSMHVRFLYGEVAYRWTFRMDGQPLWDKPMTPYKGTTTTSTTVVLETR